MVPLKDYPMSKNEELEIIRDTVRRLGPDSYCGPWLSDALPAIEQDLRSDFAPSASIEDARKEAARIISEAAERGKELLRLAQLRADQVTHQANQARGEVSAAIRAAERVLHGY